MADVAAANNVIKKITCFGYRCLLGSQCKKKGATLKTRLSNEAARHNLLSRLIHSPYHCLSKEDAEDKVKHTEYETWEVDDELSTIRLPWKQLGVRRQNSIRNLLLRQTKKTF